jgi:hypothetical protein
VRSGLRRTALEAVFAGVVATAAEAGLSAAEVRVLGVPPYAPDVIAERLARRAGVRLDRSGARLAGAFMRAGYGPVWGLPALVLAKTMPAPLGALLLASSLFGFELAALPLSGATVLPSQWPRRFLVADAMNTLIYSTVAVGVAALLARRA